MIVDRAANALLASQVAFRSLSGRKIGTEQAGIRRFIGKTPNGAKTQINRPSRQLP